MKRTEGEEKEAQKIGKHREDRMRRDMRCESDVRSEENRHMYDVPYITISSEPTDKPYSTAKLDPPVKSGAGKHVICLNIPQLQLYCMCHKHIMG